jgi:peptidyl-prolyl cis-trans isomerase A (cyclophilin A)
MISTARLPRSRLAPSRLPNGGAGAWLVILLLSTPPLIAAPEAEGLYADFITSNGDFSCQLDYRGAPRTVANFVSLAEGSRDWIDFPRAKVVRRPFYDGLTFHRVMAGFMIQGGSPNGSGTDGPGYQFADEFHPALLHDRPGVLSMANSGPNSSGSQFFITVTNTPWLDGKHSVFGRVVEGMEIVFAISQIPTDTQDQPRAPVMIEGVRIVRRGHEAEVFDPQAVVPSLPAVGGRVPLALSVNTTVLSLKLQPRPDHLQHVLWSRDLKAWRGQTFRGPISDLEASSLLGLPLVVFQVLDGAYEP